MMSMMRGKSAWCQMKGINACNGWQQRNAQNITCDMKQKLPYNNVVAAQVDRRGTGSRSRSLGERPFRLSHKRAKHIQKFNLFESLLRLPRQTQVASLGGALCSSLRPAMTNKSKNLFRASQQRLTSTVFVLIKIRNQCNPSTNIDEPLWYP